MRALHLVYMRGPGNTKLRYYPTEFEPLIIPWWFTGSDREIILAFYQQILGHEPLPRIEVDWYRSLVPADRGFLQHIAERRRSIEHLVVVKVRGDEVDLRDVLTHPDLQPFRYVAVTCDHSLANESFGRISELAGFVLQTSEDLYEEMAAEFSLREDGPELLAPLVQTLLNPTLVVEAYNALIDVQAERVDPDNHRDAIYRRILRRLLENMLPQDAIALSAFALRGREGFNEVVPAKQQPSSLAALRARMLIRDDRLVRWAQWLENADMVDVLDARVRSIANPAKVPRGAKRLLNWLDAGQRPIALQRWNSRISTAYGWLKEGQVGRVRDELAALERELTSPATTGAMRAHFWNLLGRLRLEQSQPAEAANAFGVCVELLERGKAPAHNRGVIMHNLAMAQALLGYEAWVDAEPIFREALRLLEEANAPAKIRGVTMAFLAQGLRDHGKWQEADLLFRKALENIEPVRSDIIDEFARGLRDNGCWQEAEPLFRKALGMKVEGSSSRVSRAVTMRELACGLLINGRLDEATVLYADALKLMNELGNDAPSSRAQELRKYARRMRNAHRLDEAAEIEALAAKIESSG